MSEITAFIVYFFMSFGTLAISTAILIAGMSDAARLPKTPTYGGSFPQPGTTWRTGDPVPTTRN